MKTNWEAGKDQFRAWELIMPRTDIKIMVQIWRQTGDRVKAVFNGN